MPSLKQVQKVVPSAETVAGRVIAFHHGKHVDLGQYAGEDAVILSQDGEKLMAGPEDTPFVEVKSRRKVAPNQNAKQVEAKPEGGLDLTSLNL